MPDPIRDNAAQRRRKKRSFLASPPLVAAAGWFVPGSGYVLIGDVGRGLTVGVTIVALFMAGVLIAGIRVIDVPGYDNLGRQKRVIGGAKVDPRDPRWEQAASALSVRPLGEIIEKPWFVAQVLAGPIALLGANWSLAAAQPDAPDGRESSVPMSHARIFDIGSLYTAVAGMLNLLAMIDSAARAGRDADADASAGPAPAAEKGRSQA
jgi:hypothetical protein